MRQNSRTELLYEDIEELPAYRLESIAYWLREVVDSLAKICAESQEAEQRWDGLATAVSQGACHHDTQRGGGSGRGLATAAAHNQGCWAATVFEEAHQEGGETATSLYQVPQGFCLLCKILSPKTSTWLEQGAKKVGCVKVKQVSPCCQRQATWSIAMSVEKKCCRLSCTLLVSQGNVLSCHMSSKSQPYPVLLSCWQVSCMLQSRQCLLQDLPSKRDPCCPSHKSCIAAGRGGGH